MKARLSLRAALVTMALIAPLATLAPPGVSNAATSGSLRVTPGSGYVGGQAMNFSGNIGAAGVRKIRLESNMNRAGEGWSGVEGFRAQSTKADGSFDFTFTAPSMFGIRYRVVSQGLATSAVTFDSQSQDLTLEPVTQPVAGRAFDIEVDTTPELVRRPDTKLLEPFPGRELTLQRRLDDGSWEQVGGTTQVGQYGLGYFRGLTEARPGTVVYRVIQGDWTEGENKIGWMPSFPTYVDVRSTSRAAPALPAPVEPVAAETERAPLPRSSGTSSVPAAKRYSWGKSFFDFAWVFGESLTSPAYRGEKRSGWWLDYSDGSGRAAPHNGRLVLDSKRDNDTGAGDFGTTRATLRGIPMTYGRWETRLRVLAEEANARDYQVLFELVPDRLAPEDCSRTITVAKFAAHSNKVSVGVNAGTKKWTKTRKGVKINDQVINFAVEVSKRHITWFMNGQPIATVRNKAAVSDVPLTMRMSMVGSGQQEMNRTRVASDWERGWTLARGKQVRSGPSMKQSSFSAKAC